MATLLVITVLLPLLGSLVLVLTPKIETHDRAADRAVVYAGDAGSVPDLAAGVRQ